MEDPSGQQEDRHKRFIRETFREVPFFSPIWNYLVKEGKALREGAISIVIIAVLAFYFGANFASSTDRNITVNALIDGKKQTSEDEWPPLNDFQISKWAKDLSKYEIVDIRVFWGQEVNAQAFFRSLQKVGKRINVPVKTDMGLGEPMMINIVVNDENLELGKTAEELFAEIGFPVKLDHGKGVDKDNLQIFIGDRT